MNHPIPTMPYIPGSRRRPGKRRRRVRPYNISMAAPIKSEGVNTPPTAPDPNVPAVAIIFSMRIARISSENQF
jgi:hypothetical protein